MPVLNAFKLKEITKLQICGASRKPANRWGVPQTRSLYNTTVENLWDKYAVSSRELETRRAETLKTLDGFLKGLEYLEEVP